MRRRQDTAKPKRIKKQYEIQFVLKPGEITYSRKVTIDPGERPMNLIKKMLKNLIRQHPELFTGITPEKLKKWRYFYGFGDAELEPEELDPGLSITELGIFPGSAITVGPKSSFK